MLHRNYVRKNSKPVSTVYLLIIKTSLIFLPIFFQTSKYVFSGNTEMNCSLHICIVVSYLSFRERISEEFFKILYKNTNYTILILFERCISFYIKDKFGPRPQRIRESPDNVMRSLISDDSTLRKNDCNCFRRACRVAI